MLRILRSTDSSVRALVDRRATRDPELVRQVATIVRAVQREGDRALRRYARRLDGLEGPIEIVSCMTDGDGCPQYSRCNLRLPVQKIQASISRLLDTMSLSELASDGFVPVAELASTT